MVPPRAAWASRGGRRRLHSAIVASPRVVSPDDASFCPSPSFLSTSTVCRSPLPPSLACVPAPACSLALLLCLWRVVKPSRTFGSLTPFAHLHLTPPAAAAAAAVVFFVVGVVVASLLFRLLAPGRRSFSVVVVFVVVVVRPSSASWLLVGRPSSLLLRCLLWRPPLVGPSNTRTNYVDPRRRRRRRPRRRRRRRWSLCHSSHSAVIRCPRRRRRRRRPVVVVLASVFLAVSAVVSLCLVFLCYPRVTVRERGR